MKTTACNRKSTLCILSALLMAGTPLTSCLAAQQDPDNGVMAAVLDSEERSEAGTAEETVVYEKDDLPAGLDLNGRIINCLTFQTEPNFAEEETGDIVNDAIFRRNNKVMERLNVGLHFDTMPGNYDSQGVFVKKLEESVLAGDAEYDMVAAYSMAGATIAEKRMSIDLTETRYLDFSKPWWPDSLIEQSTVGGKLYFASGDISTEMLYMMMAVYFNKQLLEAYHLEDPYELVRNGEWTVDKMKEMSSGLYKDLNGDGQKNIGDQFGCEVCYIYADGFYFSGGLHIVDKDENDMPFISPDYGSERTQKLIEKLCVFFHDTNDGIVDPHAVHDFKEGIVLFTASGVEASARIFRDMDMKFGILPMPKGFDDVDEYITCVDFTYSNYSIPITAKSPDEVSAVMECLGSESYRTTTPAVFEQALKAKYSHDTADAEMFDIIRAGVSFDLGRIYTNSLGQMTFGMFRDAVHYNKPNWMSFYEKSKKRLNKFFDRLLTSLTAELES